MLSLNMLPRLLLKLPRWLRFSSIIFCNSILLIVYVLLPPISRNPSILAIPIALAGWMFMRRGVLLTLASIIISLWIFYSIRLHTIFLPLQVAESFLIGSLALLVEGLIISSQRVSFDRSDEAHQKMLQVYEQQQQLNLLKDQFILNVNHELRTPLTAVYGYLELLIQHYDNIQPARQKVFLKNALYSCEELQLLVNNVLDTIHISQEQQFITREDLLVATIVQDVLAHIDPRYEKEHTLTIEIPPELSIYANAQYTRQILRNLLSNAYKYAPANTPIHIYASIQPSAHLGQHGMSEVCICVQDAGPGIPPAEIPRLFGQFVRLQRDISGKVRGTGLGLYVSKQLVEAMGGRIWAESTGVAGEGSCFSFTLPHALPPLITVDAEISSTGR